MKREEIIHGVTEMTRRYCNVRVSAYRGVTVEAQYFLVEHLTAAHWAARCQSH